MLKDTLVRAAAAAGAALAMSGVLAAVTPLAAAGTTPTELATEYSDQTSYLESNYPEGEITEVCDPSGDVICILPLPAPED